MDLNQIGKAILRWGGGGGGRERSKILCFWATEEKSDFASDRASITISL
jgi:hypothetical protein